MRINREVQRFTDGACRGNPGPGGSWVLLRSGKAENELWGGEPEPTNNRMELTPVIGGLEALNRASRVVLATDSQYVRKEIIEEIKWWKAKGRKNATEQPVNNRNLRERLCKTRKVAWSWVKGHWGHLEDERSDSLANRGIDELGEVRCDK